MLCGRLLAEDGEVKFVSRFAFYISKLQHSLCLLKVINSCAISRTLHVRSLHTHQRILHIETESSLLSRDRITRKIFCEKGISRRNMHTHNIAEAL